MSRIEKPRPSPSKVQTGESQSLDILLVEDDEDDYVLIRDLLQESLDYQFSLDWVSSGEEAWDLLCNNDYDAYLVDFLLGATDGIQLSNDAIREGCNSPIIIMTGQGGHDVDLMAMKSGAADFLVKGEFGPKLLERSIRYAIEHNRLINQLNEMAVRDNLTGLFNRREMNRFLEEEIERFRRYNHPFSLIMADIDHFKRVNDQHGHLIGDKALGWIADILKRTTRSLDRVVRYGGEEFLLILPETSISGATRVAERIREYFGSTHFLAEVNGGEIRLSITLSLGVVEVNESIDNSDSLLKAADKALYEAKRRGRNQTVVFSDLLGTSE